MTNLLEKYANLVDALLNKTREGKVPWEIENPVTISVDSINSTLKMSVSTDENFENVYSIDFFNHDGNHVDGFNDVTLNTVDTKNEGKSYFTRMEELYSIARRIAKGADKTIDDFLRDLDEGKLGMPF